MVVESQGQAVSVACWVLRLAYYTQSLYLQSHVSWHKSRGLARSKSRISVQTRVCLLSFSFVLTHISVPGTGPSQIRKKDRSQSDHMLHRR